MHLQNEHIKMSKAKKGLRAQLLNETSKVSLRTWPLCHVQMRYHGVNNTFIFWFNFESSLQYLAIEQFSSNCAWRKVKHSNILTEYIFQPILSLRCYNVVPQMRCHWGNDIFVALYKQYSSTE